MYNLIQNVAEELGLAIPVEAYTLAEELGVPAEEEDVRAFLAAYCIVYRILHPLQAKRIANNTEKLVEWRRRLVDLLVSRSH